MKKYRVGILGIGGTGGFFGGKLAQFYTNNKNIDVVFIARNNTKNRLKKKGLKVESIDGNFTLKPDLVSDDINEIGSLDVLLVCVKSYGLEKAINQYKNNVKEKGVVITIQNLANQFERIEKLLAKNITLLAGCAYIISNKVDDGHIHHKGGAATLFFGRDEDSSRLNSKFKWVENIFTEAGIKATLSSQISKTIWEKFLFISPLAICCSYYACTFGTLKKGNKKLAFLKGLMEDLLQLITTKNITLEKDLIARHLQTLKKLPENGKTSLQLDMETQGTSELDALLDYVLLQADTLKLSLKHYQKAAKRLKTR